MPKPTKEPKYLFQKGHGKRIHKHKGKAEPTEVQTVPPDLFQNVDNEVIKKGQGNRRAHLGEARADTKKLENYSAIKLENFYIQQLYKTNPKMHQNVYNAFLEFEAVFSPFWTRENDTRYCHTQGDPAQHADCDEFNSTNQTRGTQHFVVWKTQIPDAATGLRVNIVKEMQEKNFTMDRHQAFCNFFGVGDVGVHKLAANELGISYKEYRKLFPLSDPWKAIPGQFHKMSSLYL
ncbi:hypothetical protein BJ742DRAFT_736150 [Cladochytrium replicatum]|nr:hypothetical protein BJ742DRAFT_736150 [Cladochytrium replicatum]